MEAGRKEQRDAETHSSYLTCAHTRIRVRSAERLVFSRRSGIAVNKFHFAATNRRRQVGRQTDRRWHESNDPRSLSEHVIPASRRLAPVINAKSRRGRRGEETRWRVRALDSEEEEATSSTSNFDDEQEEQMEKEGRRRGGGGGGGEGREGNSCMGNNGIASSIQCKASEVTVSGQGCGTAYIPSI